MSKTILIIDDSPDFVEMLGLRLEAENYRVLAAYDGPEGLLKACGEEVDLILLDLMMPGMDGFEVLKRLKENAATRNIPVVIVSAKGDTKSIFKAESLGADGYVMKPCDRQELLRTVESRIGLERREKEEKHVPR